MSDTGVPRAARAAVWELGALGRFWWAQPWEPAAVSRQSQSGLGGFSLESHYELEGVLGIKSPVGPENPVVMGFTCPLHPARSQLKARRWMRLLLVWVHCDVVVVERVI